MPNPPPDLRVLRELALEYELQNDPIVQAARRNPQKLTVVKLPFHSGVQIGLVLEQSEN